MTSKCSQLGCTEETHVPRSVWSTGKTPNGQESWVRSTVLGTQLLESFPREKFDIAHRKRSLLHALIFTFHLRKPAPCSTQMRKTGELVVHGDWSCFRLQPAEVTWCFSWWRCPTLQLRHAKPAFTLAGVKALVPYQNPLPPSSPKKENLGLPAAEVE